MPWCRSWKNLHSFYVIVERKYWDERKRTRSMKISRIYSRTTYKNFFMYSGVIMKSVALRRSSPWTLSKHIWEDKLTLHCVKRSESACWYVYWMYCAVSTGDVYLCCRKLGKGASSAAEWSPAGRKLDIRLHYSHYFSHEMNLKTLS